MTMKAYKNISIKGFTLIEAMIATVIASVMSIGVITIYVNQTGNIAAESQRESSIIESNRAYDLVTRLLRQAQTNAVVLTYNGTGDRNIVPPAAPTLEIAGDNIAITFQLPLGFNSWPNNVGPLFNQNIVQISWDNTDATTAHQIRVRNADTVANLAGVADQIIAGDNIGDGARIINLDVWPMTDQFTQAGAVAAPANNGYFVSVTARSPSTDRRYVNPDDPSGDLKHFRTHTVSGIVTPRN